VTATVRTGVLVSFCGIDGSGKTTQLRLLEAWLRAEGSPIHRAKVEWPATSSMFELAKHETGDWESYESTIPATLREFVIACDVVGYYRRAIEPVLERGTVVLWDRSPLCYRAYARAYGADPQWGDRLYATIPAPSVTVLLDLSPAVALQRLIARQTQPIRRDENVELLTRVRNVYRKLSRGRTDIVTIDASRSASSIAADIRELVRPLVGSARSLPQGVCDSPA